MNIKEFREILTVIGKLDPKEAKYLCDQATNKDVSDEELGKSLESRISKYRGSTGGGMFGGSRP